MREAGRLKMTTSINPIDIGVRVEVPNAVMAELSSVLYEAKLEFISPHFDDRIRTFCMCPAGEVIMESTGVPTRCSPSMGTAMQISRRKIPTSPSHRHYFTKPFHEPIAYGKYIARLAIFSAAGAVQRFGDLMHGQRSTAERIERGLVRPTLETLLPATSVLCCHTVISRHH